MKLYRTITAIIIAASLAMGGLAAAIADEATAVPAGNEAPASAADEETVSDAVPAEEEMPAAGHTQAKQCSEEKPAAKPEPAGTEPGEDEPGDDAVLTKAAESKSELPEIPEDKEEADEDVTIDGENDEEQVTEPEEEAGQTEKTGEEPAAKEDETADPEEKQDPDDTETNEGKETPETTPGTPTEQPKETPAKEQPAQDEDEGDTEELIIAANLTVTQTWNGVIKRESPTILKLDLDHAQTVHMLVEGKNISAGVCKADRNPEDAPRHDTDPETNQTVITWSAEAGSYLISLRANEGSLLAKVQVSFLSEEAFASRETEPAETEEQAAGKAEEADTPAEEPEKPAEETQETADGETPAEAEEPAAEETGETADEETLAEEEEPAAEEVPEMLPVLTEEELAEQGFLAGAVIREEGAALYGTMDAETEPAAWLEAGTALFVKIEDDTWGRIQTVTDGETAICGYMKLDDLVLTAEEEQAEELPVRTIRIVSSLDNTGVVTVGTKVELKAELNGFSEEDRYTVQWQYTPDGGKTVKNAEGATGLTYSYRVDKTNYAYGWRVKVTLAPAAEPEAEPAEEAAEEAAE